MKNKSIIISEKAHKELKILSEGFNTNYGNFVEQMILYFKKTGNNPTDQKNYSASQKLQVLDKRLVSFLKVQEREILKPMRQEVFEYHQKQESLLLNFQNKSVDLFKIIDENNKLRYNKLLKHLEKQQKALVTISDFLDKKNKQGLISNIQNIFK